MMKRSGSAGSARRAREQTERRCEVTQPLHVLLVDDHQGGVDSLGLRLKRTGYRTSLAPSGAQALETARSDPPDVAVLDVRMADQNGYETCRELKRMLPALPVIIYTESADGDVRYKANDCGADELITEPADPALVMQRIVQLLAR
jgi:two-component system OmpR family response regulator